MEVDKIEKENICVVQRLAAQPDCVRGLRIKTDGGERRKRAETVYLGVHKHNQDDVP